jgi:hypothetical protein
LIANGKAGPVTRELAENLKNAKRGRPPFGAKHLWYEIAMENAKLKHEGKSYADRMAELGKRYMLRERQIEEALLTYERATDVTLAIFNEENRDD